MSPVIPPINITPNPALREYYELKAIAPAAGTLDATRVAFESALLSLRKLLKSDEGCPVTGESPGSTAPAPPSINLDGVRLLIQMLENDSQHILHRFVSGTLASALSSDSENKVINAVNDICDTLQYGLQGFRATGGVVGTSNYTTPSANSAVSTNDGAPTTAKRSHDGSTKPGVRHRLKSIMMQCKKRDEVCVVDNTSHGAEAAHVIPFSLQNDSAGNPTIGSESGSIRRNHFWRFLEMFLGEEAVKLILTRFAQLDVLENIILLGPKQHVIFGKGLMTLRPVFEPSEEASYNPRVTTEACYPRIWFNGA